MRKFSIISIVGRAGAGKGIQAKLLQEKTGFVLIRTGDLLRKRAQKKDIVGKIEKWILKHGRLTPTPIVFSLWMPLLEKIKNEGVAKGIIFDGNPRKLYEGQMLEEVFEMFGWQGRFRVCHIRLSEKMALRRLLQRKRSDDTVKKIKERFAYFPLEVVPMIKYYKQRKLLVEIDGAQSIEIVHKEIMEKLNGFLK